MGKLGERLLRSAREARAIVRGGAQPGRTCPPPQIEAADPEGDRPIPAELRSALGRVRGRRP